MPGNSSSPEVSADTCPLCGEGNGCAMAAGCADQPCWCVAAFFSEELMARVPPAARGLACVCATCAASENVQPIPRADEA